MYDIDVTPYTYTHTMKNKWECKWGRFQLIHTGQRKVKNNKIIINIHTDPFIYSLASQLSERWSYNQKVQRHKIVLFQAS